MFPMTDPAAFRFLRLIPSATPPRRADRDAGGLVPLRAARWCDALAQATQHGFLLHPPADVSLLWDGERILWHMAPFEDWQLLDDAIQFPDYAAAFDAAAPPGLAGCSPPFLTALPEPGVVQLWTGLVARTPPGWSLLLRAPANAPRIPGTEPFEGLVETDRWQGPLFVNLRLTRPGEPVHLRAERPLALAQPVPQAAYADALYEVSETVETAAATAADWAALGAVLAPPEARAPGAYAIEARRARRRACPYAAWAGRGVTSAPAP
jgi:hypothetical protein